MFYRCEFWHFRRKPPLIFLKFFGDLMNQIIKEYAGKKCFTINNCRYTFVSCYDIQSLFPCHLLFPTRRLRTFFPLKGILKSLWFYQVWKSSEVKIHSGKSPQIDFKLHPAVFACWRSTGWILAKKQQLLRYANILYDPNQLHIVRCHFF